jgi:hypothetical protein
MPVIAGGNQMACAGLLENILVKHWENTDKTGKKWSKLVKNW